MNETPSQTAAGWSFAVDRGGTFTDVVGVDPAGGLHFTKLLSESRKYPDSSIEGIRRLLGIGADAPLEGISPGGLRFGSTVATNALLERRGGRTLLLLTEGFGDLLLIGHQARPDIFALSPEKPARLEEAVVEVPERLDARGHILRALEEETLLRRIEEAAIVPEEWDAVAVVLLHAWRNPLHEEITGRLLERLGFKNVVLSHLSMNRIKAVGRGGAALVDAYLSKVLGSYLDSIKNEIGAGRAELARFMQSNGTLASGENFKGKSAVLSGPAGGVAAVAETARSLGVEGAVGFDMGGTSTDVSLYSGRFDRVFDQKIAGVEFQAEALNINTVASGGGSVLWFDGHRMRVGPGSAGARPGPASYGLGGPPALTDANLVTGRISRADFPEIFGPGGDRPLDEEAALSAIAALTSRINDALGTTMSAKEAALGFIRIAEETMAQAIREISISRGVDVRTHALVSFGGAGGQHACGVAELLGIERIVFPPLASVFSAYGIGRAVEAEKSERTVLMPYSREAHQKLEPLFLELKEQAAGNLGTEGRVERELDLRPRGADAFITVPSTSFEETLERFEDAHLALYGFKPGGADIEAVNIRVKLSAEERLLPGLDHLETGPAPVEAPKPKGRQTVCLKGNGPEEIDVYGRDTLTPGASLRGPLLIADGTTTLFVKPGWEAASTESGSILLTLENEKTSASSSRLKETETGRVADPVLLEVFHNLFSGIAAEMGRTLENTAHSVNIKERLDFSCAVFDPSGELVANAPHIPVHLGAMADTVKALKEDRAGAMRPGDMYISNNPYRGGSHLPDVTAVCPVFSEEGDELLFFTAARGHHADIGGSTPGSMPPAARQIEEEGVLLDSVLAVRDDELREKELKALLSDHPWPARNIPERLGDLGAQLAACHKGARELRRLVVEYGYPTVAAYMKHMQENAASVVRETLCGFLKYGRFNSSFSDRLDDGTPIKVRIEIEEGENPPHTVRARIDFGGSGPEHTEDNLNAPLAVVRSALLYCLRTITGSEIPLNGGCLIPVDLVVPEGSVLNPRPPAPVASGNVETSQRVVDVILGAFGVAAASQGTMNNLLFEVEGESPYYETIGGGAGATMARSGASGIQVHMTNTRITDPEVLEHRHPGVRLERFSLRRGSGGGGKHAGGDGIIREISFLKPARVSIISERRLTRPPGLGGGGEGQSGRNILIREDGVEEPLGHRVVLGLRGGERIRIETPGGGGAGAGGSL